MPRILENRLIAEFKDRESFTREELFDFFSFYEPDLKEGTFGWRIFDLKNKNIIKSKIRGFYTLYTKPEYKPVISKDIYNIAKRISSKFTEIKYCLWEIDWINEFSQHQANKNITFVEIEKDFVESLYYELKDRLKNEIYLNPDENEINFYISESNNPVVIKRLISRSPVTKHIISKTQFYTPSLEKMLVDLFTEDKLFYFSQGSELVRIYENALNSYSINFTTLLYYAKRRAKEQELKAFLANNLSHLVKEIFNDKKEML